VKTLPLSRGLVAEVDDDIYEFLNQWKWSALKAPRRWYAVRMEYRQGRRKMIYMHRLILGVPDGVFVDHIDGDGLRNLRANLRPATPLQNVGNQKLSVRNTSGYRGVFWRRSRRCWVATISIRSRSKTLGQFDSREDAARAYDVAARAHFGAHARLNLPDAPVA
jgi:hypothetical protein